MSITDIFIKKIREYGQLKASLDSGVKLATIKNWTAGTFVPSIKNADKVARAIGYELVLVKKGEGSTAEGDELHKENVAARKALTFCIDNANVYTCPKCIYSKKGNPCYDETKSCTQGMIEYFKEGGK